LKNLQSREPNDELEGFYSPQMQDRGSQIHLGHLVLKRAMLHLQRRVAAVYYDLMSKTKIRGQVLQSNVG